MAARLKKEEKAILRELLKRHIKEYEEDESTLINEPAADFAMEIKYDNFLKELLKKLE